MTTCTISIFDLLLRIIRDTAILSDDRKQVLSAQLEAGQWTPQMKAEISALCTTEVSNLNGQIADADAAILRQEKFLERENGRTDSHAQTLMDGHEEDLQTIVDAFEIECLKQ